MTSLNADRRLYYISAAGLVLFAVLSAGRDVMAKELFDSSKSDPVFATFYMSAVTWAVFQLLHLSMNGRLYLLNDFVSASTQVRWNITLANIFTLVAFLTALLAVDKTDAYVSSLIDYGGSPVIMVVLAWALLRERSSGLSLLGVIVSLIGVITLVRGLTTGGIGTSHDPVEAATGAVFAGISALAFGLNQIFNKHLVLAGITRERLWIMRLPLIIIVLGAWSAPTWQSQVPHLLVMTLWSLIGVSLPLYLLVYAFENLAVTNIASFLFLIPLFTFIGSLAMSHFAPNENLALYLGSGLLVLIGIWISERASYESRSADKGRVISVAESTVDDPACKDQ